ncbi:MAG: type II toxin-antitoxin system VapC family toxin [Chloroflexi bacterium]|nr:type II toxin-antitoxin system VapC family toxin [Chloroflexota bacterium]
MTVVVDASALVSYLLASDREHGWTSSVLADEAWACPELALAEASNILRRMELTGDLSRPDVTAAYAELLQFEIDLHPFAPYAVRIWELRNNLTIYDAWYVALAEALNCPLVTLDRRLSRAQGPTCAILSPH